MLIGYARVSTDDQNLDLQIDALKKAGCERIYTDKISGSKFERPEMNKMKESLRNGDVIVVWRLDRLGRSLRDLITLVNEFKEGGIGLKSLQDSIDTSSASGELMFHLMGALAQFERTLICERTKAGLTAARARGRVGGRKYSLKPSQTKELVVMYNSRQHTVDTLCDFFKISRPTLYKYIKLAA